MLEELELDHRSARLHVSPRLTERGEADYPRLFRLAIERHSDAWLADELGADARLHTREPRRLRSGATTMVAVPYTAPETLAEGEFNRFYVRAICRRALADGVASVVIYRAKEVSQPRAASASRIGVAVDASTLLQDLRTNIGVEPALGVPPGPNSGLSVRLP